MILSFSREIPDPKTGGKKKSFFKEKIQGKAEFVKKHTFRSGKRWKVGDKIHFWDMSPRLKGKVSPDPEAFNPPVGLCKDWQHERTNQRSFYNDHYTSFDFVPNTGVYTPLVTAIDEYKMIGNWYVGWATIHLKFAGMWFGIYYDTDKHKVYKVAGPDFGRFPIVSLALNDGFTCIEDFVYFFYHAHKFKKFEMEGQIVHWAGRSYRDLMLAADELKELM